MSAPGRWIRLDVGWDDGWLCMTSPGAQLAWVKLLCYVKLNGVKGVTKGLHPKFAAKKWGVAVRDVESMLEGAREDGALYVEDGVWSLTNWDFIGGAPKRGWAWQTIRRIVLGRDDHTCEYCGAKATHVDHVYPVSRGGSNDLDNLVAACAPCNMSKGAKTPEEWLADE